MSDYPNLRPSNHPTPSPIKPGYYWARNLINGTPIYYEIVNVVVIEFASTPIKDIRVYRTGNTRTYRPDEFMFISKIQVPIAPYHCINCNKPIIEQNQGYINVMTFMPSHVVCPTD